jgi:diadenosine tetraphosphate (Ap4A) HIT family hydrolase
VGLVAESQCPHCERVARARDGSLDRLLFETEHVIVIPGEHQYFPGYCVVISKTHVREMHQLPSVDGASIFADVLRVGKLINEHYHPLKMNYASLGNVDEHLHWHVIPRYETEPNPKEHPWAGAPFFSSHPTTVEDVKKLKLIFS